VCPGIETSRALIGPRRGGEAFQPGIVRFCGSAVDTSPAIVGSQPTIVGTQATIVGTQPTIVGTHRTIVGTHRTIVHIRCTSMGNHHTTVGFCDCRNPTSHGIVCQ
jgi:hypothetical protein